MKTPQWVVGSLAGLLAIEAPAPACPVSRPTMWELVRDSDLIAVVKVEAFERDQKTPACAARSTSQGLDCDVAVLKILETWKGSLRSEVRVNFSGSLSAYAREAAVGDQLLVFLETGETQVGQGLGGASPEFEAPPEGILDPSTSVSNDSTEGVEERSTDNLLSPQDLLAIQEEERRWQESRIGRWFVAGWGYGIREVGAGDLRPLRDFISDAIRLQDSGSVTKVAMRDWLIEAAAVASTRPYALEDLQQLLDAWMDPREGAISESRLSETEKQTLADGFIRDPSSDESVPLLMNLLSGTEDVDLDHAFVSVIEAAFAAPQIPAWTPDAIRYLIVRRGNRDWGAEMWRKDLETGDLGRRWPLLVKDLHIESFTTLGLSAAPARDRE